MVVVVDVDLLWERNRRRFADDAHVREFNWKALSLQMPQNSQSETTIFFNIKNKVSLFFYYLINLTFARSTNIRYVH